MPFILHYKNIYGFPHFADGNTSKVLKRYILRRSLYQIQARSWRDVLGHCCIKYKQQVQVRRRELEVQVGWSWWSNDNQTTFVWHVTVDRRKLSATVTAWTWTSISPKTSISFVFDTTIFTPSKCHSHLIQWSPSGSASTRTSATTRYRLYLIQWFPSGSASTSTEGNDWTSFVFDTAIFALSNLVLCFFFPGLKWVC